MGKYLFVPIHADVLILDEECTVAGAIADFRKLPYFNGTNDVNTDTANISEDIVTNPFLAKQTLQKGNHLHWALPDALTHARSDTPEDATSSEEILYPQIPNCWLVTRSGVGVQEKRWVIESDYLYPIGTKTADAPNSIVYPFDLEHQNSPQNPPFRYMGRQLDFDTWNNADKSPNEYLNSLTAIGYGEPTFAAFYPNCRSVLGFWDEEPPNPSTNFSYQVIGWYVDRNPTTGTKKKDPFLHLVDTYHRQDSEFKQENSLSDFIKENFEWQVEPEDPSIAEIQAMICYASIEILPHGLIPNPNNVTEADGLRLVVHNTGTEALSTLLADIIGQTEGHSDAEKLITEQQLEYVQLIGQLKDQRLDLLHKFNEARHEKGFTAISGGLIWNITPDQNSETETLNVPDEQDLTAKEIPTLPDHMTDDLHRLNLLQQQYDRALDEIISMQQQLFSDWYKYMLCAYPADEEIKKRMDMDATRLYIEEYSIKPLEEKLKQTSQFKLIYPPLSDDEMTNIIGAEVTLGKASQDSLAANIVALIQSLIVKVSKFNQIIESKDSTPPGLQFKLNLQPQPRYWEPNNPVILLEGDLVEMSTRHGQDGRFSDNNLLKCHFVPLDNFSFSDPEKAEIDAILQVIDTQIPKENNIAFCKWEDNPWHPIMLHWGVEIFPLKGAEQEDMQQFSSDYLTSHFTFKNDNPELSPNPYSQYDHPMEVSGSMILTPDSKSVQEESFYRFINSSDFGKDFLSTLPTDPEDVTIDKDNLKDFTNYLENLDPGQPQRNGFLKLVKALDTLKDLHQLSQSMGGFDAALLMHKQTLQLPIADPLGFKGSQAFSQRVKNFVQNESKSAPAPHNHFLPIRTGQMKLTKLTLLDTFGQFREVSTDNIIYPHHFEANHEEKITLPPRITQPTRLNFRWLSAWGSQLEMIDHPITCPICGWLLINHLDQSLLIYDPEGTLLGILDTKGHWQSAPGQDWVMDLDHIPQEHLRNVVSKIVREKREDSIQPFIDILEDALENVDPEGFRVHQDLTLMMSRPIAVVRAQLSIRLKGKAAINQSWPIFWNDLQREGLRSTEAFDNVEIPIRIGDSGQLNDGILGYWKEDCDLQAESTFQSTASQMTPQPDFCLTLNSAPQRITLLMDPGGKANLTCGLLPTKVLDIPAEQYANALQKIFVTFLSSPILCPDNSVSLPLPHETGYEWIWLQKHKHDWYESSALGILNKDHLLRKFEKGNQIWNQLIKRAWIAAMDANQAQVLSSDQRQPAPDTPEDASEEDTIALEEEKNAFEEQKTAIEHFLDQFLIIPANTDAQFFDQVVVREGWLKLRPSEKSIKQRVNPQ
jgi:hypothetical protein